MGPSMSPCPPPGCTMLSIHSPVVPSMPPLTSNQGLTLVRFSAQPEPFMTLNTSPKRLNTPSAPA